jgi:Flp pilus assembly protein protease CpaA
MRKKTVRTGLKFMLAGILLVMVATFFPWEVSQMLFLGIGGEARVTFIGFFLGGMCGGCGVLVAAAGLLQGGRDEIEVRLAPTILLLISLVILFFVFAYNSLTTPRSPSLPRGESVQI